jgi:hypothetical protein
MNTSDLRTNLETCLLDARNNNEDIPQLISTISGNSEEMKQILETINLILKCKSMINKQKNTVDNTYLFKEN